MADTVASIAPWLIPGQTAGDDYARLMHQSHQQKNEDARLGMEQQQFKAQQAQAAQTALARKQFQDAFKQLDPKDPDYQKKIAGLMLQLGPSLGMGGGAASGALKAFSPPPAPPQVTDLTGGVGVPNPKTQPSPEFTGKLADILKQAGAPPVPSPPTGVLPGTGKIITDSKGNVHIVQPRPIPQPRPAPAAPRPPAIPRLPEGSKFNPATNGAPAFFSTPQKSPGMGSLPKLSDKQFDMLGGADQTNLINSIAQAQTNRLGGVTGSKPKSLPMPSKKEDLKKGQSYTTARGEAVWDGEKFVQP
jgi:hypothetical protein